ncbi:MAG: YabP family protein [Firmicutes bacterium ADurb.Bin248]|jgi:sporulation protein YqfC|nr:MAG: YabP family protein [Firmicutes bacterium ADurb.Bin248]HOG00803.1 YabP/YqfC family sporulation protein [Clostridia bacterium]HPK15705.1 YabP/YqfC family sporulation protein [Clostridia bacterium]
MGKGKRRIRLGRRAAEWLDLPEEILTGRVKVTLYAMDTLVAENHGGVFECAPERVRLRTAEGILRVEGRELTLEELSGERALVRGEIIGVSFEK